MAEQREWMGKASSGLRHGQKCIWKNWSKRLGAGKLPADSRCGGWRFPKGAASCVPLGIPVVKDRIVQTALKLVIEPIFEREFEECSYGFRPGRGCKDALREVERLLREGNTSCGGCRLGSYFDTYYA